MTIPVFFSSEDVFEVGPEWYEKLKKHAFTANKKRSRLCLHHVTDDPLHEMIIVFHKDAIIPPHRHQSKSESYHMVFGELDIILFDDNGHPIRTISMGDFASGKSHVYRMNTAIWHSVIIRSEYAAIHEVTNGPFNIEETETAPWAPVDPEEIRDFLAASAKQFMNPKGS